MQRSDPMRNSALPPRNIAAWLRSRRPAGRLAPILTLILLAAVLIGQLTAGRTAAQVTGNAPLPVLMNASKKPTRTPTAPRPSATPTSTSTATATSTATSISTATGTSTATATSTAASTSTATGTSTATATSIASATGTSTATATSTSTATLTPTA